VKIVLDTNVFISAVFFGGLPYRILDAWRSGRISLVLSPEIFEEYRRVGEELGQQFEGVDISPVLQLVVRHAEFVQPGKFAAPVCRDSEDDKFLECAVAAAAEAIVSGDRDLLSLSDIRSIPILSPRQFVDAHMRD
jgi:putative PIN family toxin of toxin-antitoxin system